MDSCFNLSNYNINTFSPEVRNTYNFLIQTNYKYIDLLIDDTENDVNVRPARHLVANCQEIALNFSSASQWVAWGPASLSGSGMFPVVGGQRRELVQEEHCLSSWQPESSKQPCISDNTQLRRLLRKAVWLGPRFCTTPWPLHGVPGAPRHGEAGTVSVPLGWFPHPDDWGLPAPRVAAEAKGSGMRLFWG